MLKSVETVGMHNSKICYFKVMPDRVTDKVGA